MAGASDKTNGKWTLANIVLSLFTAALLMLTAWMLTSIIELREFAARGDRFTITDGNGLRAYVDGQIAKLEIPPSWFRERVHANSEDIKHHEKRIDELERKL